MPKPQHLFCIADTKNVGLEEAACQRPQGEHWDEHRGGEGEEETRGSGTCGQGGDGMVPLLEHPRKAGLASSLPPEREKFSILKHQTCQLG